MKNLLLLSHLFTSYGVYTNIIASIKLIKQMSSSNPFFERNTIKNIASQMAPNTRERSKRALSVANLRLNPAKFLHREVFDNRLYDKTSYFKLEIPEEKERERDRIWQAPKDL